MHEQLDEIRSLLLELMKVEELSKEENIKDNEVTKEPVKKTKSKKLTPKELATKKGEPWVDVVKIHVDKDNIHHGFFELDWNDLFIKELKKHGYGYDGDSDESTVDRWFRAIVYNILEEEGMSTDRNAGYINVSKLKITPETSE